MDQFCPGKAQHVFLFLRLRFRDHDDGAVAHGCADKCQTDSGVPGRAFDNRAARLQLAARNRIADDVKRRAVLYRLSGIHEFALAQNGAAGQFTGASELEKWRIADRFGQITVNPHGSAP